jgi:hypothetical protein
MAPKGVVRHRVGTSHALTVCLQEQSFATTKLARLFP